MVISHEHKFVYLAPEKTGSTSIALLLEDQFGGEVMGYSAYPRHDCFVPEEFSNYFTFISVRNPYDRFFSSVAFWRPEDPFDVSNWCFLPPITDLISVKNVIRLDAIVRLENVQVDMNRLPFVEKELKVNWFNKSNYKKFTITEEAVRKVRDRYLSDFLFFGYDPDVFPTKPLIDESPVEVPFI